MIQNKSFITEYILLYTNLPLTTTHLLGIYLLTISCNGQQVSGSPFKVRVAACMEAPVAAAAPGPCSIVAIGYGLSTAKINKETEFLLEGVCNGL